MGKSGTTPSPWDEKEYFDDIQDVKVTKDMLDLAKHIVTQKTGEFEPEKFEDHYEEALVELRQDGWRETKATRRERCGSHGRAEEKHRQ
jgi:non-homologous end joining protein Ku